MVAKIIAFIAIIYLLKLFLYPFFMIVTKKQKNQVRKYANTQKEEERRRQAKERTRLLAKRLAKPFMSEPKEDKLKMLLTRLNKDQIPEEVALDQIILAALGIVLSLFMFLANNVLGFISVLFVVLGWFYPIDKLKKEFDEKNTNIALDFPEFYSIVFYQYSRSVNIFLADVIRDYLPNANEDLADELGVMLDNIDYADETYALRQLKKRVPKHFIIKFCDIMETRLRGYDNISQMQYLKNEIDTFRVAELEKELESRKRKNDAIQLTLVGILMLYIMIYFLFSTLDALKMFQ